MTTSADKQVEAASGKIREILHNDQIETMTAPELCQFIAETKPLTWSIPELLDRTARQLNNRLEAGNLTDDHSNDPKPTVDDAVAALHQAAETVREASKSLEAAHNALARLADS